MELTVLFDKLVQMGVDLGGKLIAAAAVLLIGMKLVKWVLKLIKKSPTLDKLDPSLHTFINSFAKIGLYALLVLTVAQVLGLETTSFLTVLASASVAIGLSLQGALSNFAGGLMLLLFKPFKVGDYILASGEEGTVRGVGVFYTWLDTADNKVVTLPNGTLTGSAIVNYSANATRRVTQTYTASYDAPVQKVIEVLTRVAESHPLGLKDPAPMVRLANHGASALEYTVRVWCRNEDYWTVHFDLLEQVQKAFEEEGIEIPYPQMDVHTR